MLYSDIKQITDAIYHQLRPIKNQSIVGHVNAVQSNGCEEILIPFYNNREGIIVPCYKKLNFENINLKTNLGDGESDVRCVASAIAVNYMNILSKIITRGIYSLAFFEDGNASELTNEQTVRWDYEDAFNGSEVKYFIKQGLSVSKLINAIKRVKKKFPYSKICCVASNDALLTLMHSEGMERFLNVGRLSSYSGCDSFIASEFVENNVSFSGNKIGEYAYVFAEDQVIFGHGDICVISPNKNAPYSEINIKNSVGCVRLSDEALVRIEIIGE